MRPNAFAGVGLDAAAIEHMGRRALGSPQLAWHYTSANSAKGILATGNLCPAFSHHREASDDFLRLAHLQKVLYFTVDDSCEPSIASPIGRAPSEASRMMTEGGGGWYRFGYPEHLLFPVHCLPLDVIPVENAAQILGRVGMENYLPPPLRPLAHYPQVQFDALRRLREQMEDVVLGWRVSLRAIELTELSAIDSLDDDLMTWNRIWTNETTH